MLGQLTEQELNLYNDILKCRALGRELNEEEQLAARLLNFDWTYRESDSGNVVKAGVEGEEELMADIDASGISDEQKMEWLTLFGMTYEAQALALKKWQWVRAMRYVTENPERSKVSLALSGVTSEQYTAFIGLQAKFRDFSMGIIKAGCTQRLIMTDDTINFALIRERATDEMKKDKELFFFGVTVPQRCQDIMDDIVRNHKALFISMVETGAAKVMFPNFQVDSNNPGGVWLVTMQCTGDYRDAFGFFFSTQTTRPRREWAPKLQDRKPAAPAPVEGFIQDSQDARRAAKSDVMMERRDPAKAHIPAIPERRVKAPMALSNRPMVVTEKAAPKKVKTAPKKRAKQFAVIRSVTS